jgi:TonB-dependent starch-binding outer membrane protein SusC
MKLSLDCKSFCKRGLLPTKLLLVMRITAIFILGATLHVSANSFSQSITISAKKITIEKAFRLIEDQTDFSFLWNESLLDKSRTVCIDVKDAPLSRVLDICLRGLPLSYRIKDNVVLIELIPVLPSVDSARSALHPLADVHGRILNEDGQPLPGATVTLKGTTIATVTDEIGNFHINTGDETRPVLVVSFIGYLPEEYPLKGRNNFTIKLRQDIRALGEIVIVGYGEQRKRDVTGAISTVKSDEIAKRPLVRVEQALQGTTPGVAVESPNGMPGTPLSVRIRGVNSITGSNEPIYVIDGYIGANLGSISPSDIESLEILKDASATAIYGSRASNGVVIITTKSGHDGAPRLNVGAWVQKDEMPKYLKLMDAYDFANTVNTQIASTSNAPPAFSAAQLNAFKTNPGTDWQKAATQKPIVENYEASVSGGSPNSKYFFAFNFLNQPGILLNQYYKRASLRSNLDFKIKDKLDLKFNVVVALPFSRNTAYTGDSGDPFASAVLFDPTAPVRNPATGQLTIQSSYGTLSVSPVAQETNQLVDGNNADALGTGVITYHILKNLSFTSSNSYETNYGWNRQFFGLNTSQTVVNGISAGYAQGNSTWSSAVQTSNFLTYKLNRGDHALTVVGLFEYQEGTNQNMNARSANLSTYALGYYNLGLGQSQQTTSGYSASSLQSFMGRINYAYKDKYLLTASVRDDGSSVLTKKYSTFPSVGLGWVLSKEKFMENSRLFNSLKLRGSYGETGNQGVPPYSSIAQINTSPTAYYYVSNSPSVSTPLGPPVSTNLRWETTLQTDVGFDATILDSRLTVTIDAYKKKISNLLYFFQTPAYLGGGSYETNIGGIQNRGIEIGITGSPIKPLTTGLNWTTHFEISFNDNKVLNLDGQDNIIVNGIGQPQANISILKVGQPVGEFTGFKFLGTWKTSEAAAAAVYGNVPGDAKYLDVNKDGHINQSDYVPIGNGVPKFTWGFINDFRYGNFMLTFMFAGQGGSQIYSQTLAYTWGQAPGVRNATLEDATKMWTAENQTDIPHFSNTTLWPTNSSRFVYSANFVKLKNLSLTYSLPQHILGMAKVRSVDVYVSGQNLFTISNYPGFDPELTNATNAMLQGVEMAVVPNARTYTLGCRIGF